MKVRKENSSERKIPISRLPTTDYNPKTCFLTTFPPPLPVHAPNNKGKMPPEIGKLAALTYLSVAVTKVSGRFAGRCDWSIFHSSYQ